MIKMTIDGKECNVAPGTTVLEAATQLGIQIPTLCHHKELTPYGACRLCIVEITTSRGRKKMVTSCLYPAEEGLVVETANERVLRSRKMIIELLLARCPNVKKLQDLAAEYGVKQVRFAEENSFCILCGMCVRVCNEVLGIGGIGFSGRGPERKVDLPFHKHPETCIGCGACTYVCPTGAIQMEKKAVEQFRHTLGSGRSCRYARMGFYNYMKCPNNFECYRCELDQFYEDTYGTHPAFIARPAEKQKPRRIGPLQLPPDRFYHAGHTWLKRLNGVAQLGIDDLARTIVGKVEDLQIIPSAPTLERGSVVLETITAGKKARLACPVEGEIVETNTLLTNDPSLLWKDPYGKGWVITVKVSDWEKERDHLMDISNAESWMRQENDRLYKRFEEKLGATMADGGPVVSNLPAMVSNQEWEELTKDFFAV